MHQDLQSTFGSIDIYLFDQLLKCNITQNMKLLDAGCGVGRNLVYFLRSGYDVSGVDKSVESINHLRTFVAETAPNLSSENFRQESVERMSFPDATFDVVISSAVLHFARDEEHWHSMVNEMWRVLKTGGMLFARLASTVGLEDKVQQISGRRFHLPDGSDRFLVDYSLLDVKTKQLGGEWVEPFKTVLVHNMRSMSNWCIRKTQVASVSQ